MNELFQQLCEAVGVSGDEYEVRSLIRDLVQDVADEWRVDAVGNLIAIKKGTGESDLKVLVDAHMDEIGMIITGIDSNGTLQFINVGGIDPRTLAGQAVVIGRKKVPGVIGMRPTHLVKTRAGRDKVPAQSTMRIDIGAKDKGSAASKVSVGDRATFLATYAEIGDDDIGRTAVSKALDDRIACAAIIELLRGEPYPFDLYASFTVQEEAGMLGAKVIAHEIEPDVALILECTPAYDVPNELDTGLNTRMGHGPCLYVMDARMIQDPRFVRFLMQQADANDINYQIRRPGGGGTNTGYISRTGIGRMAATIGMPSRYAHTGVSMINLRDYDNYLNLIDTALRNITPQLIERK